MVKLNGQEVDRASIPPFIVDITRALHTGENLVEIEVLAPLRNHFVGRALAEDPQYSHMAGFGCQLVPAGLMGPLVLSEASVN